MVFPQIYLPPHRAFVNGDVGIYNPERGFSIRGGSFDVFSNTDYPNESYYNSINGHSSIGTNSLEDYLDLFPDDGISMVEIEAYIKYNDNLDSSNVALNNTHINNSFNEIPDLLKENGLKSHFILNSSLKYCPNNTNGVLNTLDIDGPRYRKNIKYFDEASPLFTALNPYIAVAHLGWIDTPWDFNKYRLSGNWKKSNYDVASNYPIGNLNNIDAFTNYHGTYRESTQRSSWGVVNDVASIWSYQSAINTLKKEILNKTLEVFEDKKVLIKSTTGIATHIGNTLGITNPVYAVTYPTNHMKNVMEGPFSTGNIPSALDNLKDEDKFLRIGYYDGAFGGDTYSHYWTIGNGHTEFIPWSVDYSGSLGVDWAANPYYTDATNLRLFRGNMWVHGEMPVYETEDPTINTEQNNFAWSTSSFNRHHQYYSNWYSNSGAPNKQYDYEIGEGMSSGRLQDGFYSALKLKYFNYTSFNISHNNLLDGRSPYEMHDGFDYSDDPNVSENLVGNGIPKMENTAISGWKNRLISQSNLNDFGMPVSDQYFKDQQGNNVERTAYDYIRDHLGYRLELKKTAFEQDENSIYFSTKIFNRGFAAPQNKRKIYFLLLNEDNEVLQYYLSDKDWRNWQPDNFSNGLNNATNLQVPLVDASYSSLDNLIIGGIPLGEHGSDWHHNPIMEYQPNSYVVEGFFDLTTIPKGSYKVAIFLPDNSLELKSDPKFAVRFANQATYIPCLGATVLGSFGHFVNSDSDSDGDGLTNNQDNEPFRPNVSGYTMQLLEEADECEGKLDKIFLRPSADLPVSEINIFPNPARNSLTIISKLNWTKGTISTPEGQFIQHFKSGSNQIDISNLKPGVYMMTLISDTRSETQRFVKN